MGPPLPPFLSCPSVSASCTRLPSRPQPSTSPATPSAVPARAPLLPTTLHGSLLAHRSRTSPWPLSSPGRRLPPPPPGVWTPPCSLSPPPACSSTCPPTPRTGVYCVSLPQLLLGVSGNLAPCSDFPCTVCCPSASCSKLWALEAAGASWAQATAAGGPSRSAGVWSVWEPLGADGTSSAGAGGASGPVSLTSCSWPGGGTTRDRRDCAHVTFG